MPEGNRWSLRRRPSTRPETSMFTATLTALKGVSNSPLKIEEPVLEASLPRDTCRADERHLTPDRTRQDAPLTETRVVE
jgi:hypothetical protein